MDDLSSTPAAPHAGDPSHAPSELPVIEPGRHALFLDFDGTLAPIVQRPADAMLPAGVTDSLRRLHAAGTVPVAIVTGRTIAEADRLLAPLIVPIAGSHGAERRDARARTRRPEASIAGLDTAVGMLEALARRRTLIFEPKAQGASLHYRGRDDAAAECLALADEIRVRFPALKVLCGKAVVEVMPTGHDKGQALAAFMDEWPFAGRVPVAVGDDVTDEDAFEAAQKMGGLAIKVGSGQTVARYRAATIEAIHDWLAECAALAEAAR